MGPMEFRTMESAVKNGTNAVNRNWCSGFLIVRAESFNGTERSGFVVLLFSAQGNFLSYY